MKAVSSADARKREILILSVIYTKYNVRRFSR